jgi:DNA-directed RNA polymerase subunit RPC12/RpoP
MKNSNLKYKEKRKSDLKYTPIPEFITCPTCSGDIELWSDAEETICIFCGYKVFKKETTLH